jgi:hypothetical protein
MGLVLGSIAVANDRKSEQPEVLAEWIKPEVTRISAGSAEDSSGPATDMITNPS